LKGVDLEQLVKFAKKHKLRQLTVDKISFEFRDPVPRRKKVSRETYDLEIPILGNKMPADDEMLYYSAGPQLEEKSNKPS